MYMSDVAMKLLIQCVQDICFKEFFSLLCHEVIN